MTFTALSKEAEAYEAQEEWDKAGDVYERLNKLDPDDARWQQAKKRVEAEKWLAERYAEGAGYIQQKEWLKAQKPLADVINKRPDYKDAVQLLGIANQRGKGQPDQVNVQRRRLYTYGGSILVAVILVIGGIFGYSQTQIQNETAKIGATATAAEQELATLLTATAAAQATTSEADSATKVAVAVQGTQLAEVRGTQTAEARATKLFQDQRTATAAAIATKTAQAPTATPTNTRTPRPTPTPTATIDADPTVYDNFNNPANDGTFNLDQWRPNNNFASIAQQDGFLVVSQDRKVLYDSTLLNLRKYDDVSWGELTSNAKTFFEGKLMLDPRSQTGNVQLTIWANTTGAEDGWFSQCFIGLSNVPTKAWATCGDTIWPTEEGHYYSAEGREVDFGTWHTFRIEVDPNPMIFTYYIDGQQVGSHTPIDSDKLKNAKLYPNIGVWGEDTSPSNPVIGYIDDIRIGQVGE